MTIFWRACGDLARAPQPSTAKDAALIARLAEKAGIVIAVDPSVDYEDWMEPATLLDACLAIGLETVVLQRGAFEDAMSPDGVSPSKVTAPISRIAERRCPDMLLGQLNTADMRTILSGRFAWPAADHLRANRYGSVQAVLDRLGRRAILADIPGEPAPFQNNAPAARAFGAGPVAIAAGEALLALRRAGLDEAFVKQVAPAKAHPPLIVSIAGCEDAARCEAALRKAFGLHFLRFEGEIDALLVQERIAIGYEMRFFVVGGRVVTGAGCVESQTPAQNRGSVFDGLLERRRNIDAARHEPALAARLAASAQGAAAAIVAETAETEDGALTAFTLDVGIDLDRDEPVVIELNPATSAGLYAIDARALVAALLKHAENKPLLASKYPKPPHSGPSYPGPFHTGQIDTSDPEETAFEDA